RASHVMREASLAGRAKWRDIGADDVEDTWDGFVILEGVLARGSAEAVPVGGESGGVGLGRSIPDGDLIRFCFDLCDAMGNSGSGNPINSGQTPRRRDASPG